MKCPSCSVEGNGRVTETTNTAQGTFRRRQCPSCKTVYSTLERPTKNPYPWGERGKKRSRDTRDMPIDT